MTFFWLRDYNIRPKKELHSSLWVKYINIGYFGLFGSQGSKLRDVPPSVGSLQGFALATHRYLDQGPYYGLHLLHRSTPFVTLELQIPKACHI